MNNTLLFVILLLLIPFLVFCNLMTGSVEMGSELWKTVVMTIRLPQTLTAMSCGAGLSVAGLLMQTIFRNPLAGPSVLGVSSAASLGVAFVLLLSGAIGGTSLSHFGVIGNSAIILAAIAGSLCVMIVIVWLSRRVAGNATLLISGVMIGYIASAIIGVLKAYANEEDIHAYVIWGLGSFSRVSGGQVGVFVCLIAILLPLTMLLAKPLNMMLMGTLRKIHIRVSIKSILNLGLNVKQYRMWIIGAAGILTAVVTAYCGPIMFLGLAVPHIARGIFRTSDHRILLPATLICGAELSLLCNLISKMPGANGVLPINSVTALIGAPIALYVLLKRKSGEHYI